MDVDAVPRRLPALPRAPRVAEPARVPASLAAAAAVARVPEPPGEGSFRYLHVLEGKRTTELYFICAVFQAVFLSDCKYLLQLLEIMSTVEKYFLIKDFRELQNFWHLALKTH